MGKIIIENTSNASDYEALEYVKAVISIGRVSNNGRQYSYLTVFRGEKPITVATELNKKSDKFFVY